MNLPRTPDISGTTDVYLIVGDPVEQVKAPESFNLIFARLGIDAVLVPVQVAPADLDGFVRTAFKARNIKGLWVAIPHKVPITGLLDECTELGRVAGAVNAVRRNADGSIGGALFDGVGFVASLAHFGIDWRGKRALIIGAGGGSAAIGASLALGARACSEIAFYDPVPGKAAAVAARIQRSSRVLLRAVNNNDPAGYDLVINGSPLGLQQGDPMPCDVARMAPDAVLIDILMKNQPTPLLRAARARPAGPARFRDDDPADPPVPGFLRPARRGTRGTRRLQLHPRTDLPRSANWGNPEACHWHTSACAVAPFPS